MARQAGRAEEILEPDLPIIDAHHHLYLWTEETFKLFAPEHPTTIAHKIYPRYLLDELFADLNGGHNVIATVYVENGAMFRQDGPEELRTVGEVEFANGIAAMAASGLFGKARACAGIVGSTDLRLGDKVEPVLRAMIAAGNGRLKSIRSPVASTDADYYGAGYASAPHFTPPDVMRSAAYRAGFKWLHRLGLAADVWIFDHQLQDLAELANAFPETQIILNHLGTPQGAMAYAGKRQERFGLWRDGMQVLARCPNVVVKIGGLGMHVSGFASFNADPPATSAQLAAEWRPYVETCIACFGADRAMFESNFPADGATGSYAVLWNTFKRLAAGASGDEKAALFRGTAQRVYTLDL